MRLPGGITQEQHALMQHWSAWRTSDAPYVGMGYQPVNMLHRDAPCGGGGRPSIRATSETAERIDVALRHLREAGYVEAHALCALYYGLGCGLARAARELGLSKRAAPIMFREAVIAATATVLGGQALAA